MREKIWNLLIDFKYKAFYLNRFNSFIRSIDIFINITGFIFTSATVASWLVWQDYPIIWATIISIIQIIGTSRPFLPYLKEIKELSDTYYFHEYNYVEIEKLWYEFENNLIDERTALNRYSEFKVNQIRQLEKLKIKIPDYKSISNVVEQELKSFVSSNYNYQIN